MKNFLQSYKVPLFYCCQWIWASSYVMKEFGDKAKRSRKSSESFLKQGCAVRGRAGRKWRAAALDFFGKLVMKVIEKGWNIHWGRKSLGIILPDFHPSSTFPRGGGLFLTLLRLDQKCHSISARWALLIWKSDVTVMRAQWAKVYAYIWTQEMPAFPTLSPMLPGLLPPKTGGSLSVCRFLLPFACLWLFPLITEIGKTKALCPRVPLGPAE